MTQTEALYQQDFYAWIYHNIELLRQRNFSEINIETLIEELEDMARQGRHELESRFIILIAHLLKWEYQFKQLKDHWKTYQGGSWRGTIKGQRLEITKLLKHSPSLRTVLAETVQNAYQDAVEIAVDETGLPQDTFPLSCPYRIEELLDKDFYPDTH